MNDQTKALAIDISDVLRNRKDTPQLSHSEAWDRACFLAIYISRKKAGRLELSK